MSADKFGFLSGSNHSIYYVYAPQSNAWQFHTNTPTHWHHHHHHYHRIAHTCAWMRVLWNVKRLRFTKYIFLSMSMETYTQSNVTYIFLLTLFIFNSHVLNASTLFTFWILSVACQIFIVSLICRLTTTILNYKIQLPKSFTHNVFFYLYQKHDIHSTIKTMKLFEKATENHTPGWWSCALSSENLFLIKSNEKWI